MGTMRNVSIELSTETLHSGHARNDRLTTDRRNIVKSIVVILASMWACLCVLLSRQAFAQGVIAVDKQYHQCITACTSQLEAKGKVGCITFDDFSECIQKDAKCAGVPKDGKTALGDFCRACGNASSSCTQSAPGTVAPPPTPKKKPRPPAVTPMKPSLVEPGKTHPPGAEPKDDPYSEPDLPPPPKSDEKRCEAAGGVWVDMQVEDEKGEYHSKKSCFTLEHAYEWIVGLQSQINDLKKNGDRLSTEQLVALRTLAGMRLPPDLMERFSRIETALEWMCRPTETSNMTPQQIRDRGKKDGGMPGLIDRCARMAIQVEENRKEISKVRVTADNAFALAKANRARLSALEGSRGCSAMLRAGALASAHIIRTPVLDETAAFLGAEGGWMPCLSNRFAMNLFVGVGYSSEMSGSNSAVMDLGAGFSYIVSPTLRFGIDLYGEHYYRDNESSKVNFYGSGLHVSWLPLYRDENSFSPMFTIRAPFGVMRSDVADRGVVNQFGIAVQGFAGLAFWDGPRRDPPSSGNGSSPVTGSTSGAVVSK